ncbi:MAG TPA: glycosyl hydrolase [Acidobacteriota bacterium]|nr:glycosyl hydrolase [Acidobacteriota bacterium]
MDSLNFKKFLLVFLSVCVMLSVLPMDSYGEQAASEVKRIDSSAYQAMRWRCIGPFRGGRVTAVTGIPSLPYTYYFGACGGGVWKTEDGGLNWSPISDGYFKTGSVGAVAVSEWDPNVVYVGMGEAPIRGNVSHGDGMYKSVDGGKTWKHIGLGDTYQISRVRIHPRNPDLVYAAALGHVYGPNMQRGVFRSKDGGETWEKILYVSDKAGAIDLILDPFNPRVIYAAFWSAHRTPYSLVSGGPGSGLYKSTDSGDTWEELHRKPGMPQGALGKIGVAASGAQQNRVWAIVEAEEGGVFRSDDGGKTWTRVNSERRLRQRAWYYSRIYADPKNPDKVYVLNTGFYRSTDGGRTFSSIRVPHGDNHDLWIDPNNPNRMINSNDGGANVSYNGGISWTPQDNQPTAQFYHVTTDDQFPYWVYGAQQDNSTVRIASRTTDSGIGREYWHSVGGGESGHIAPKHDNPDIVYAGSYGGLITRWDYETRERRAINPWPENPMGWGAKDLKYRFQWTAPILVSRFDSNVLYHAAQVLFKSTDEGHSWEVISPDLTRNDKSKQKQSGGPITKDDTSVEYYCTIFAVAESVYDPNILWVGSDDGLVHITRNGGKTWTNITPKNMPEWSMISMIETSTFEAGRAFIAVDRHKLDDFSPYIYMTKDFGKTWEKITNGLPKNTFVRVVREDPERKGLLYAGTETGVFVSFDEGKNWQSLQLNLPVVPVRDMVVKEDDLVAATHGRAFWILDDLTPLHQLTEQVLESGFFLFKPRDSYRMGGYGYPRSDMGENPPSGSVVYYYFKEKPEQEVTLEFLDSHGNLIKEYKSQKQEESAPESFSRWGYTSAQSVSTEQGMNRFVWDMRYPGAERVPGAVYWGASFRGPLAVPGDYTVRLKVGEDRMIKSWKWKKDPRIGATQRDLQEQFDFLIEIRDKVTEVNQGIKKLRNLKQQINDLFAKIKGHEHSKEIIEAGEKIIQKLTAVEDELIQSKSKSGQDPLNYPIKLDNKIAALASYVSSADFRPTEQSYQVFHELSSKANSQLGLLNLYIERDVKNFNRLVKKADIPAVIIK